MTYELLFHCRTPCFCLSRNWWGATVGPHQPLQLKLFWCSRYSSNNREDLKQTLHCWSFCVFSLSVLDFKNLVASTPKLQSSYLPLLFETEAWLSFWKDWFDSFLWMLDDQIQKHPTGMKPLLKNFPLKKTSILSSPADLIAFESFPCLWDFKEQRLFEISEWPPNGRNGRSFVGKEIQ